MSETLHASGSSEGIGVQSSSGVERRSHEVRRAEAEQRMLAAAMQLVAAKGLAATTLTEVGLAAGYSRSLAAHYFESRDHLLTALTQQVMQKFMARAQARQAELPPLAALSRLIEYYLKDVAADPAGWRVYLELLHEALVNPAVASGLAALHAQAVDSLAQLIRAGIAAGELRPRLKPRAEAVVVLAALRGLAGLMVTYPADADLAAAARALAGSLTEGLRRRPLA